MASIRFAPIRSPLLAGRAVVAGLAAVLLGGCTAPGSAGSGVADESGRLVATAASIDSDRPSAAGDYLAGRFALDEGDLATAAERFGRALEADPTNLELLRQLLLLELASGSIDRALATGERVAAADPEADEAKLLFALRDLRRGDFAAARAWIDRLSSRGVTGLAAPLLRAWTMFAAGDEAAALALIAAGGEAEGLGQLRRYHEAAMLGLAGRPADGATLLRAELTDDAPTASRIVLTLAGLELAAGRRAEAATLLRRQAELAGDDGVLGALAAEVERGAAVPAPIPDAESGVADALLGLAEALTQQRAGAQGLLYARLATWLRPDSAEAWLLIGRIEASQDNFGVAVAAFEKVPDSSLYGWEARLAQADALAAAGDDAAAVALLREMAGSRPQDTSALRQLGDLHRQSERFGDAEQAYGEAIDRLGQPTPEDWRLYYARGVALERLRRWPEAETYLSRALELSPDQPLVLNYLGYSWVDQGLNLDRAKEMLHRAVELRSQDGFIVDSLGWAYFRLGEYEKAATHLERAVELEPGDPVINDHLGDAYWRVGREREARFQWQRALSLDPETDTIAEIETKLRDGLPSASAGRG